MLLAQFASSLMSGTTSGDYYPLDEDLDEVIVPTSVRMKATSHSKLLFIAELWNALDKVRGKKRLKKWKPASVMARLIDVGIVGVELKVGVIPEDPVERKARIAKAADVLQKLVSDHKKKQS